MRYNRLREITIKKTVILLIVNLILWLNTAKTGLLECYDQETCSFIDRNLGRDLRVMARGTRRNPEKDIGRDAEKCQEMSRNVKRCREIQRDAERCREIQRGT